MKPPKAPPTCQQCGGDLDDPEDNCSMAVNGSCGWVMVARTFWTMWNELRETAYRSPAWDALAPADRSRFTGAMRLSCKFHHMQIDQMFGARPRD